MEKHFAELVKSLLSLKGPNIVMINSGNWGDGLIREGTVQMFKDIGFIHTLIPYDHNYIPEPHVNFIYSGGGGWCFWWDHASAIVNRAADICKKVIVLPSTYGIRNKYRPDVEYWARDKFTSLIKNPYAKQAPDNALWLKPREVPKLLSTRFMYRTDLESPKRFKLPEFNHDISLLGNQDSCGNDFITAVGIHKEVFTNRLHVAIAGHLAGSYVTLSTSGYVKIPDLYNTWLRDSPYITYVD